MIQAIFEFLWSNQAIRAVQQFFGHDVNWLFVAITYAGAHEVVALVAALALCLSGRRLAYALMGIIAFALATDMLLWQMVGVERPSGPDIWVHTKAPVSSFPSGHVVTATVVWGLLAVFNRIWKTLAAAIVLAVMVSRLYLGMHYLGDVLGGVLIGLILLLIFTRFWPMIVEWLKGRSMRFFVAIGVCAPLAVLPFIVITDRAWVAFGSVLGASIGLLIEYYWVHYRPESSSLWHQTVKALVEIGVAGGLTVTLMSTFANSPIFQAAVFALVALWLTLGAPAFFRWWKRTVFETRSQSATGSSKHR